MDLAANRISCQTFPLIMPSPNFTCAIGIQSIPAIEADLPASPIHGADIRFHGVVRDSENGRPISGIDYSFYEGMAIKELETIGESMAKDHPDHLAMVYHRIGEVPAGEASILIRVQTVHSAEAFFIAQEYLKRIKKSVPIWKNPLFLD